MTPSGLFLQEGDFCWDMTWRQYLEGCKYEDLVLTDHSNLRQRRAWAPDRSEKPGWGGHSQRWEPPNSSSSAILANKHQPVRPHRRRLSPLHQVPISSLNYAWTSSAASRPTKISTGLVGWGDGSRSYRKKTRRRGKWGRSGFEKPLPGRWDEASAPGAAGRGPVGGIKEVNKAWKMAGKKTLMECSTEKTSHTYRRSSAPSKSAETMKPTSPNIRRGEEFTMFPTCHCRSKTPQGRGG